MNLGRDILWWASWRQSISISYERSRPVTPAAGPSLMQSHYSQFALAFLLAQKQSSARVEFNTFDSSVVEIEEKDLKIFLEALCEQ